MCRLDARGIAVTALLLVPAGWAHAQVSPLPQQDVAISLDTGWVTNDTNQRGVIATEIIHVPGADWVRLQFDQAVLGQAPAGGEATLLRLTSLFDGGVQTMNAAHLVQWQHSSAYFNGMTVRLEIIADPGAQPSRVTSALAHMGVRQPAPPESICGPVDDRILSNDPRSARVVPVGCTAWIIDDANHCFLTAGHCTGGSFSIVEFNVPLSSSGGGIQHPGPEDQYAVDPVSVQSNGGQGTGNDWAYFGCFPNSTTGLTPFEAQGDFFVLAFPPPVAGQSIRITGYGTTSLPAPPEWNQVQKTHVGPFVTSSGALVQYQTDTTGGNSGSPVILEETGDAIGIHTHGGCSSGGGQNSGTGANHSGLLNALANPQGVCIPNPPLAFDFPNGLPELLDPAGDTIRVVVSGQNGGTPEPGTGILHYDVGGGFVTSFMSEVSANVYDAVFPPIACGTTVRYYFSAQTVNGETVTDPRTAPDDTYSAFSASGQIVVVDDNMETNTGWTFLHENLISGAWGPLPGVPVGGGDRGDPPTDFDGSGKCWLTENVDGNSDVDGGPTRLISPVYDLTGLTDPLISYARWFTNDDNDADALVVEISNNGGASWVNVETVSNSIGWNVVTIRVADFVTPTAQVRLRYSAADNPNDSVTEAGLDALRITSLVCAAPCPTDLNGDGQVDVLDLLDLLAAWGACPGCPPDFNGDDQVDVLDLLDLLAAWGPCTP